MAESIVSCPNCNSPVLDDMQECPTCHHDLTPSHSFSETQKMQLELKCSNCGESVRRSSVRCWNCGNFMKDEIAEIYDKMQENDQQIIYSPLENMADSTQQADSREPNAPLSKEEFGYDDGFELDPDIDVSDSSYEMPTFQQSTDEEPSEQQTDEANYGLNNARPEVTEKADTPAPHESSDVIPARTSESPKPEAQAKTVPEARQPPKKPTEPDEDDIPHSVKTGGEVLLQTAIKEEQESGKAPPSAALASTKPVPQQRPVKLSTGMGPQQGVLMVCPCEHACRIRVLDRYRGKALRCPKCSDILFVPEDIKLQQAPRDVREKYQKMTEAAALKRGGAKPGATVGGTSGFWQHDLHVHRFAPENLKLKPGSLEKTFTPMDLGFIPTGLFLATLLKRPAVGKGADKKHDPIREEIRKHLLAGNNIKDLPAFAHVFYKADDLSEISVVQPVPEGRESMFAGIPVFGRGRIAVRLPKHKSEELPNYISFTLTEFRSFARLLVETFSMPNIGLKSGVPMQDEFVQYKCHYTDLPIFTLKSADLSYYELDPNLNFQVAGYACECGKLTISEDGRKKEKIGKPGKGIQKTKCPKCKLKTNWEIYYTVPELQPKPKTEEEEEPASTPVTAQTD